MVAVHEGNNTPLGAADKRTAIEIQEYFYRNSYTYVLSYDGAIKISSLPPSRADRAASRLFAGASDACPHDSVAPNCVLVSYSVPIASDFYALTRILHRKSSCIFLSGLHQRRQQNASVYRLSTPFFPSVRASFFGA
jgi:hypothetical protein